MPAYRLYFIAPSGRIERMLNFDCDTDEECLRLAEARADGQHEMELWLGGKLLKRFPAGQPPD